jgi:hypothetical protein
VNKQIKKLFERYYRPELAPSVEQRGSSSVQGTQQLRNQLPGLFKKHSITSMFDAGCNDCSWAYLIPDIEYHGGEISEPVVRSTNQLRPELDIVLHDVTSDPLPCVSVLFVRDVAIHLCDTDRQKLIANWLKSKIPWILITHSPNICRNDHIVYDIDHFPMAEVNWQILPWNFPEPVDIAWEFSPGGRCMALWHQDQIRGLDFDDH